MSLLDNLVHAEARAAAELHKVQSEVQQLVHAVNARVEQAEKAASAEAQSLATSVREHGVVQTGMTLAHQTPSALSHAAASLFPHEVKQINDLKSKAAGLAAKVNKIGQSLQAAKQAPGSAKTTGTGAAAANQPSVPAKSIPKKAVDTSKSAQAAAPPVCIPCAAKKAAAAAAAAAAAKNAAPAPPISDCAQKALHAAPKALHKDAATSIPLIMAECHAQGVTDTNQIAYILATAEHETLLGHLILEHDSGDKYEGDEKLGNTQPGDGPRYKGRGYVQLTGRWNYANWSHKLGVDLVGHPDMATEPARAAKILVQGMKHGDFRGKHKLDDYIKDGKADFFNARSMINGDKYKPTNKADPTQKGQHIAAIAQRYAAALKGCNNSAAPSAPPHPAAVKPDAASGQARVDRARELIKQGEGYKNKYRVNGKDIMATESDGTKVPEWTDCGRFVSNVVRQDDPKFPVVGTGVIDKYVQDHPERWQQGAPGDGGLQAGDVLWKDGHIGIYGGKDANGKDIIYDASLGQHAPKQSSYKATYFTKWFRPKT